MIKIARSRVSVDWFLQDVLVFHHWLLQSTFRGFYLQSSHFRLGIYRSADGSSRLVIPITANECVNKFKSAVVSDWKSGLLDEAVGELSVQKGWYGFTDRVLSNVSKTRTDRQSSRCLLPWLDWIFERVMRTGCAAVHAPFVLSALLVVLLHQKYWQAFLCLAPLARMLCNFVAVGFVLVCNERRSLELSEWG